MRLGSLEIRKVDPPPERRELERITDIGIAFEERIAELSGLADWAVAAVLRARQLTADTVASLPLEELQGDTVVASPSPILTQPDPTEIYHDTLTQIMFDLLDGGDAFLWVRSRDSRGIPKSVHVIDPVEVNVEWDRARLFREYTWRDRPMEEGGDLLHIAVNRRRRDLRGKGILEAASDSTVAILRAQQDVARSLAADNYTPTLVIRHPSVKTKDDADKVRDIWMGDRGKGGRVGRNAPSVMGADAELEQLTINPADAQWIESRAFEIQEVARLYGVPGWMLLVDMGSSMTYSNTEGVMRFWATTTLRPSYLERIEQHFSRLLPRGRRARFNLDEILRADLEARYRAAQIGIDSRFITPNEVRASEGLPPITGGDDLAPRAAPAPVDAIPVEEEPANATA